MKEDVTSGGHMVIAWSARLRGSHARKGGTGPNLQGFGCLGHAVVSGKRKYGQNVVL